MITTGKIRTADLEVPNKFNAYTIDLQLDDRSRAALEVGQGNEAGLSVPINNLGIARFTVKLDAINRRKQKVSQRVGSLWTNKNMLVIDEISMVSSKLMDSVDKQCNAMKNLDSNSTAVFGGLPVVIALGDFHQFPPVRARALWKATTKNEVNNSGTCSKTWSCWTSR